jgi:hypothetical protein
MKNIKIIALLIFVMGGYTAFSQQATSGSQTIDPRTGQESQERSVISPNPEVAQTTQPAWIPQTPVLTTTGQSGTPDQMSTPNKPTDPAMAGQAKASPAPVRTEETTGPSPNQNGSHKPNTN